MKHKPFEMKKIMPCLILLKAKNSTWHSGGAGQPGRLLEPLLQRVDGSADLLHHRGRQWRVVEGSGFILMLQHPP